MTLKRGRTEEYIVFYYYVCVIDRGIDTIWHVYSELQFNNLIYKPSSSCIQQQQQKLLQIKNKKQPKIVNECTSANYIGFTTDR